MTKHLANNVRGDGDDDGEDDGDDDDCDDEPLERFGGACARGRPGYSHARSFATALVCCQAVWLGCLGGDEDEG